jgi:hypothetical protein
MNHSREQHACRTSVGRHCVRRDLLVDFQANVIEIEGTAELLGTRKLTEVQISAKKGTLSPRN